MSMASEVKTWRDVYGDSVRLMGNAGFVSIDIGGHVSDVAITPAQAREIAAEMLRLADAADAKGGAE